MRHVLGAPGNSLSEVSTATWVMGGILDTALKGDESHIPEIVGDDDSWIALMSVHVVVNSMQGPQQQMEFIAKRILSGRSRGLPPFVTKRSLSEQGEVVLGTPLYVALGD